jgi:hypothetical protein
VSLLSTLRKPIPVVRVRAHLTYYQLFKSGRSLKLNGRTYPYLYRQYNVTFSNERVIEIPIAWDIVQRYPADRVLEVGNVLIHYYRTHHDVLDKYERARGVINEDVVDYRPSKQYDLIVSISTLEHVGWDEEPQEPEKFLRAVENLMSMLAPGGTLLMTLPIGYNAALDGYLADSRIPFTTVAYARRFSDDNQWREATWSEVQHAPYIHFHRNRLGIGVSGTATGLVVGTIVRG